MGATVRYMSMSLDGFIAGPNVGPGNGLGDRGERLHEWVLTGAEHHGSGVPAHVTGGINGQVVQEFMATGYLDDVEVAISQARAAAGDKDVLVHGAATAQLALTAGILDELELHVVPVLLGQGRRLFDHVPAELVELERIRVLAGEGGVSHLHYRVHR